MAEANQNPGTTPPAAPQNPEGGTPIGSGGGDKLIGGKFKSVDDMATAFDQGFHGLNEKIGALTKIVEQAVVSDPRSGGVPVGRGYGPDAYGRGQQPTEDDIDPKDFLLNPGQTLAKREAAMLNRVGNVVVNVVANAMAVQEFKRQNPDLVPHERVVQIFMKEADPRKPINEQLEEAGQKARAYLTSIRQPTNQPPTGQSYVEPPAGGQPPSNPMNPAGYPTGMAEDEKELFDYVKERQDDLNQRFGFNYDPNKK